MSFSVNLRYGRIEDPIIAATESIPIVQLDFF